MLTRRPPILAREWRTLAIITDPVIHIYSLVSRQDPLGLGVRGRRADHACKAKCAGEAVDTPRSRCVSAPTWWHGKPRSISRWSWVSILPPSWAKPRDRGSIKVNSSIPRCPSSVHGMR